MAKLTRGKNHLSRALGPSSGRLNGSKLFKRTRITLVCQLSEGILPGTLVHLECELRAHIFREAVGVHTAHRQGAEETHGEYRNELSYGLVSEW